MAANLFKHKMKNPNTAPIVDTFPVTLSDNAPEVLSSPTPAVSIPSRMETADKPAVFDASRVPFAQLDIAPPEKPTAPSTPEKEPARLILDMHVAPGTRPVVLILDGAARPVTYHIATRQPPEQATDAVVARLNHAPSWPEGK